jgi:hypothetical protein
MKDLDSRQPLLRCTARGPFTPFSFQPLRPLLRLLFCQLPLPPHLPPLLGTVVSAILVVML